MLHMVAKTRIIIIALFFNLVSIIFGSEQKVTIIFTPTFNGASAQTVGDKQVIDLGFLKEGVSYTNGNRIVIGTVSVNIQQSTNGAEEPCIPDDIQFNSVNISKLKTVSENIGSLEKSYIGNYSGMTLYAGGVGNVRTTGRTIDENTESFFVDPRCNNANMDNTLYTLDYDFKLYAEIPMTKKGVAGAFAQEKDTQKEIALKDIVIRQIQVSVGGNRNRRR